VLISVQSGFWLIVCMIFGMVPRLFSYYARVPEAKKSYVNFGASGGLIFELGCARVVGRSV